MAKIYWTNTAGGDFSDAADWGAGVVPGPSDSAFIGRSGTYTVAITTDESGPASQSFHAPADCQECTPDLRIALAGAVASEKPGIVVTATCMSNGG